MLKAETLGCAGVQEGEVKGPCNVQGDVKQSHLLASASWKEVGYYAAEAEQKTAPNSGWLDVR